MMKPLIALALAALTGYWGSWGACCAACALPGQEGVRRETKVGSGSLAGFRTAAPHNSIYPQTRILRSSRRNSRVPLRGP